MRLGWSDWRLIGNNAFGQLTVTIESMSSRVSRVKPLGSYRAVLQAKGPPPISTCRRRRPAVPRRPRHLRPGSRSGTAHSAPEQQANLAGLLNLLGHPIGNNEVSLIFGDAQR